MSRSGERTVGRFARAESVVVVLAAMVPVVFGFSAQAGITLDAGVILYVDDDAPPGGDGQTWGTAFRCLQDALVAAQPGSGVEGIHLGQGIYKPDQDEGGNVTPGDREATFQLIDGVSLLGGYAGYGAPDPDVRDIELYETILTGDLLGNDEPDFVNYEENSYHVTVGSGVDSTALVEGFTITAGNGNGSKDDDEIYGAGLLIDCGSPVVRSCTFLGNSVSKDYSLGGAVCNRDGSEPLFEGCAFIGNRKSWGLGGGGAIASHDSSPTINDCRFLENETWYRGGAMFIESGTPLISNCVFEDNAAGYPDPYQESLGGGAICIWYSGGTEIRNCLFKDNECLDHPGGALSTVSCSPTVSECVFLQNSASGAGGALCGVANLVDCCFARNEAGAIHTGFQSGVHVGTAVRCRFVDNSAYGGGAMNLSKAVTFEFRDCQFLGNHATGNDGGAARIGGDGAEVSFVNCIFSGNSANEDGGVIYQIYGGEVTLTNCTLSANTCGGEGAAVYSWKISDTKMVNCVIRDLGDNEIHKQDGSTVTVEYSCISGGYAGEGNIDTDPLFVDPDGADDIFGTEDDNLRLQPGSPCIDAADNTAVPYDVTTDLDGNPRFVDDPDTEDTGFGDPPIVDMGAYEFQVDNCPADVNDDGTVDIDDLFDVLSHWGEGAGPCDVNDDGVVDIDDIFAVLADWGPCP